MSKQQLIDFLTNSIGVHIALLLLVLIVFVFGVVWHKYKGDKDE